MYDRLGVTHLSASLKAEGYRVALRYAIPLGVKGLAKYMAD